MMDALGVSSHPCCDDVMASIDDQKSARRALSAQPTVLKWIIVLTIYCINPATLPAWKRVKQCVLIYITMVRLR